MFEQIVSKSNELKAQMDALRKEAAEQVKPLLLEFIKANPQVKQVKWTQYTPFFNDGEECVFRVNEPYFFFDGDDMDDDEGFEVYSFGRDYGPKPEQATPETLASCKAMAVALGEIEDALKECFGDHAEVRLTAEGVSVDEYEHD